MSHVVALKAFSINMEIVEDMLRGSVGIFASVLPEFICFSSLYIREVLHSYQEVLLRFSFNALRSAAWISCPLSMHFDCPLLSFPPTIIVGRRG